VKPGARRADWGLCRRHLPAASLAGDVHRYARPALLVLLGLALLANGAWAYPEEVSGQEVREYEAAQEPLSPERWESDTSYLDCRSGETRTCAVARHIAADGPIRVRDGTDLDPPLDGTEYVRLQPDRTTTRYYRTTERLENESVVLDLERVEWGTVLRALAVPYDEAPETARTAVDRGSVTVPVPEDPGPTESALPPRMGVVKNGTMYEVRRVSERTRITGWGWKEPGFLVVLGIRYAGWVGGAVLLVRGGRAVERAG
jgi:hypothetical protein